mgnify:CR=1 FL=1|tara:strand:- start:1401 stop:1607 length:207 start_codon:yes stop_codon:yes gene_type:complete
MATKKLTALQVFLEIKKIEAIETQVIKDRTVLRKIIGPNYSAKLVIDDVVYIIKTTDYGNAYAVPLIR